MGAVGKDALCKVLADYTRKIGEDLCMDMDAFQPSTSKIRTQFAGKSSLYMLPCRLVSAGKNGTLTVESLLRRHGLGAEAVIDDHESTWGLCAHSTGHDFQRSMFCGMKSRSLFAFFPQQEEKSQERSSIHCDRKSQRFFSPSLLHPPFLFRCRDTYLQ